MATISLQSWDTAFVLRLPAVNAILLDAFHTGRLKLPEIRWQPDAGKASMTGTFGPWQLTSKGMKDAGGSNLVVRFPIKQGTLTDAFGATYTIADAEVIGVVALRWFREGDRHKLKLDRVVRIVEMIGVDRSSRRALQTVVQDFLNANVDTFEHALVTVDLAHKLSDVMPWLAPNGVGYFCGGGTDDESSFLGVTCMTKAGSYHPGNPTPPPLSLGVECIPKGADRAFLLSEPLFVEHLLIPGVVRSFNLAGDPQAELQFHTLGELIEARGRRWFSVQDHDRKIVKTSTTPPIPCPASQVDLSFLYGLLAAGGVMGFWTLGPIMALELGTLLTRLIASGKPAIMEDLPLVIERLEITVESGVISFKAWTLAHVQVSIPVAGKLPLATVRVVVTTHHTMKARPGAGFQLVEARPTEHTPPQVDLADWLKKLKIGVEVFITVVGVILSVVTAGSSAAAAAVFVGAMQTDSLLVEKGLTHWSGTAAEGRVTVDLGAFLDTAVSPIEWGDAQGMAPSAVALDDALLIAGTATKAR